MSTHENLNGSERAESGVRASIERIKASVTGVADAGKVLTRLAPKQVKDEVQIAKLELKDKGIAVGKGAAVAVVGLIFALLMAIALVILMFVGLSKLMPPWAAALVLVLIFLVLAAILAFAGYKMIMKQLPFKPESAIFGILYDLGVLKEGSAMTSQRVKSEMREKERQKETEKKAESTNEDGSQKAPAAPAPNEDQLKQRTQQRREHMKSLRDDFDRHTAQVKTNLATLTNNSKQAAMQTPSRVANAGARIGRNASDAQNLQARWQPLATLAASVTAFIVFLGKLIRK
ncbi:phage holin family protein [Rothia sp. ZJ1223]|uniref:phage holin family protein n=1 Tax=Rothia sp. ZJ1223 TaxID=2811098 RepID=UPI001956F21F|nr:phage holin family protein [Rothia sp. ZJ1223]MBM7051339.1 phage holin family protein [Rothia sp. ZJ1223]